MIRPLLLRKVNLRAFELYGIQPATTTLRAYAVYTRPCIAPGVVRRSCHTWQQLRRTYLRNTAQYDTYVRRGVC